MGNLACTSSKNNPSHDTNPGKPVIQWSVNDAHKWMSNVSGRELEPIAKIFKKHKINGQKLINLTDEELRQMGISEKYIKRFKLLLKAQLDTEKRKMDGPNMGKGFEGTITFNQNIQTNFMPNKQDTANRAHNRQKQPHLPEGWKNLYTEDGRKYYQNDITKETQWEYPDLRLSSSKITQTNDQTCVDGSDLIMTLTGNNGNGNGKSNNSKRHSQQQPKNNSNSKSKPRFNTSANSNGSGGIGSNGGSGGGDKRRNDEKKGNNDYSKDRIDSEEEEEDSEGSVSESSCLSAYARSFRLDPVEESREEPYYPPHSMLDIKSGSNELVFDELQKRFSDLSKCMQSQPSIHDINRRMTEVHSLLKGMEVHKKNMKKKNAKNKGKKTHGSVFSYEPIAKHSGKSQFDMRKNLTKQDIMCVHGRTDEQNASYNHDYIGKSISMQMYDNLMYNNGELCIVNLDFFDEKDETAQLYLTAQIIHNQKKNRNYSWKVDHALMSQSEIATSYKQFNVSELPKSSRRKEQFIAEMEDISEIKKMFADPKIIKKTKWNKLSVFHQIYQKRNNLRMVVSITKPEFIKKLQKYVDSTDENKWDKLIPIVMFFDNGKHHKYEVHYIDIVHISDENIGIEADIGISYKYHRNKKGNRVEATGIHLDKDLMYKQHTLVNAQHMRECKCFDGFVSNITDMSIGNCDEKENKYKQKCIEIEKLKDEIETLNRKLACVNTSSDVYETHMYGMSAATPSVATSSASNDSFSI